MVDLASYVPLGDKESSSFFDEHRAHRTVPRLRGLLHRNNVAALTEAVGAAKRHDHGHVFD